jgi:hypothetical protein
MRVSAKQRSWISLGIIFSVSTAIAFWLIGRQVFYANWGAVDDSEIFSFIGTPQRLPITDLFHTLLTQTEVGDPSSGRFRPGYYFLLLLEAAGWGKNVHLWYLARTLGFATFIASLWWLLSKFVRIWLAAALVLPILLLPFWADVWSRLGPSEIYGTWALGLMLFGIRATVQSPDDAERKWGAALVTSAALILIGSKETFIPLSGAAVVVLAFAGFTRRIPLWIAVGFSSVICLCAAAVVLVIQRVVLASGQDFYANTIDPRQLLGGAGHALYAVAIGNGLALCYAVAILFFGYCARRAKQDSREWLWSSCTIVVIFIFMAAVYFTQQVVYRGQLPLQTRYDFPAALFVPFGIYVLICYVAYQTRRYLNSRFTGYISILLAVAIFAVYAPGLILGFGSKLPKAVAANIQKTDRFFAEILALAAAAKDSPGSPIILEVYGPEAFEAVAAVQTYVRAMGAENPISVRLHMANNSKGALYDRLESQMRTMQRDGDSRFVPLAKSLANPQNGCISVGINEAGSAGCTAFEVRS